MSESQFNKLSESEQKIIRLLHAHLPIGCNYKEKMLELREAIYNRKPRGEGE